MNDYHSDYSHVSQTMLKCFAERRMTYYKTYVTQEIPPADASRKMDLGTMAHAALLEPHNVDALLVEIPDALLSGTNQSISSNEAKLFVSDAKKAGKVPLKAKEIAVVHRIAKALAESDLGEWFSLPSLREQVIRWVDATTGVKCRMRGDLILEMDDFAIGLDIKTTDDASPQAFNRVANSCHYELQASHYKAGIAAHLNKRCDFYFIAVETSEPFAVGVYRDEEPLASDEYRAKLLGDLISCQASNDWRESWERNINGFKIWKR